MFRKLRRKQAARRVERRLRAHGYEDSALLDAKIQARENGYEMSVTFDKHPAMIIFAEEAAKFFYDEGGPNFVEMIFATNEGRAFTLTVAPREPGILSPAEVVGRLRKAVDLAHPWFEEHFPNRYPGNPTDNEWPPDLLAVKKALRNAVALYQTP